jgi:hypothetical protein
MAGMQQNLDRLNERALPDLTVSVPDTLVSVRRSVGSHRARVPRKRTARPTGEPLSYRTEVAEWWAAGDNSERG